MAAPHYLESKTYNFVEDVMVTDDPALKSAAALAKNNDLIEDVSVYDTSFSRQLSTVTNGWLLPDKPSVILHTYKSAIPVADAVRGYYHEAGWDLPVLTFVHAKNDDYIEETIDRESKRLQPFIDGAPHVSVIDQYIVSGETIDLACTIALRAGARQVTAIRGRWYHEALAAHLYTDGMTSIHGTFMHTVSVKACEAASALT